MRHKMTSVTQMLRLPIICVVCQQPHRGRLAVCAECTLLFAPIGPACRHCAIPLPDDLFLVCGQCGKEKPDIDCVITAYRFEEPLRSLLHEFKYHEGLYLGTFLTNLMLQAMPTEYYETQCLIPVPMHPARLRQRGFNQAAELAKHLGRRLKLPYALSHCQKIINTVPQAGLNASQRKRNLLHAFQAKPLPYQHVTLIDDLLTTGSTANELARMLKNQGVTRVDLWCCARVIAPS